MSNLENTIDELRKTKELNQKQKNEIENKVRNINNKITIIIMRLQSSSERLNDISMKPETHKTDDGFIDYIDSLIDKFKEVHGEDCEIIKELVKMKKSNEKFLNTSELKIKELFK